VRFSAIAAHIRIRILLAFAVVVIGGGVFAVTEIQRRGDTNAFEQHGRLRNYAAHGRRPDRHRP
jgi:hypothetical protein